MTIRKTLLGAPESRCEALPPQAPIPIDSAAHHANICSLLIFRVTPFIMRLDQTLEVRRGMSMNPTGNAPQRLRGRWLGLAALTMSGLVLGLDITILVTALTTLSAKLNATTDQLQWMSAAYTLALAGFMLPAGVLGDRLGRKRMLLFGLVTFGISSVIASQMTSANGLILMRVIMGASGAIVLPLMQSMLPSMFLQDERQRAIGFSGAGAFMGLPLGPLI